MIEPSDRGKRVSPRNARRALGVDSVRGRPRRRAVARRRGGRRLRPLTSTVGASSYAAVMSDPFPVLDVSAWEPIENEVLGQNPKVWLRAPGGSDRQSDWLFKPVVTPPSTGLTQGEDWAEKIVSELAVMLGVPCAEVQLARRSGLRGSISRNIVPAEWSLILGSDLLRAKEGSYVSGRRIRRYRCAWHTPTITRAASDSTCATPSAPSGWTGASQPSRGGLVPAGSNTIRLCPSPSSPPWSMSPRRC